MEYRSAIVDECGTVRYWCSEMTGEEIEDKLLDYPEWTIECVPV